MDLRHLPKDGTMPEILFVHGALVRDGDRWWRAVPELVEQSTGVRNRIVALPWCGETRADAGASGLADDARALHRALDDADLAVNGLGHAPPMPARASPTAADDPGP